MNVSDIWNVSHEGGRQAIGKQEAKHEGRPENISSLISRPLVVCISNMNGNTSKELGVEREGRLQRVEI